MMIRHNHRHSKLLCTLNLTNRRDSIVAGDDRVHPIRLRLLNNLFIDPVSILDSLRNLVIHMTATTRDSLIEKIRRANSINVIVSNNPDMHARADFLLHNPGREIHPFHQMGIVEIVKSPV